MLPWCKRRDRAQSVTERRVGIDDKATPECRLHGRRQMRGNFNDSDPADRIQLGHADPRHCGNDPADLFKRHGLITRRHYELLIGAQTDSPHAAPTGIVPTPAGQVQIVLGSVCGMRPGLLLLTTQHRVRGQQSQNEPRKRGSHLARQLLRELAEVEALRREAGRRGSDARC